SRSTFLGRHAFDGSSGNLVFLFSSRRRHTRFSRDWSSDVCSSDLNSVPFTGARNLYQMECPPSLPAWSGSPGSRVARSFTAVTRSEERRVGKECRRRRTP